VAEVARSAIQGIAEGINEAGDAAEVVNETIRSAIVVADDLGKLAREAVRQVLVGSAEGWAEIVKVRRAEFEKARKALLARTQAA